MDDEYRYREERSKYLEDCRKRGEQGLNPPRISDGEAWSQYRSGQDKRQNDEMVNKWMSDIMNGSNNTHRSNNSKFSESSPGEQIAIVLVVIIFIIGTLWYLTNK